MTLKVPAKPVVAVYLLPEWSEQKCQALLQDIVKAAASVPALDVHEEEDIIVLFPADRMKKSLGEEIHIEVKVPEKPAFTYDPTLQRLIAGLIGIAVMHHLPMAHIQCTVAWFSVTEGFWAVPHPNDTIRV